MGTYDWHCPAGVVAHDLAEASITVTGAVPLHPPHEAQHVQGMFTCTLVSLPVALHCIA